MGEEQTAVPPVIGVALLVVVVILLAVTTLLVFSPSIRDTHHPGSYAIEHSAGTEAFELTVQATDSSVPLDVRVDGRYVTTFDPQAKRSIELTNISAGDRVTFVTNASTTAGQSYIVYATTVSSAVGTAGPPALLDPPASPTVPETDCIGTIEELQTIDHDGWYELCHDIDARESTEWRPIGDADDPFTGSLDGNGHAIVGLTVETDSGAGPAALFGYTTGRVQNLTVRDIAVAGGAGGATTSPVADRVGTLAGTNAGTIRDVSVSGTVTGHGDVGGVVGHQTDRGLLSNVESTVDVRAHGEPNTVGGMIAPDGGAVPGAIGTTATSHGGPPRTPIAGGIVATNDGTLVNVRGAGPVTVQSADGVAGGLVGLNRGDLARSKATGDVTASQGTAGGITAINDEAATLEDVYATAAVTADAMAGGLVATNYGSIRRSYAVGPVRAAQRAGGLLVADEGTVAHSYWAPNETRQSDSAGTPGAHPRSHAAIRTQPAQLHGLGFGAAWDANGDGLPRLDWETDE
jgi:hypothetical protein